MSKVGPLGSAGGDEDCGGVAVAGCDGLASEPPLPVHAVSSSATAQTASSRAARHTASGDRSDTRSPHRSRGRESAVGTAGAYSTVTEDPLVAGRFTRSTSTVVLTARSGPAVPAGP